MSDKKTLNQKVFALQAEVGAIAKDSKNPFFNSKYFDINGLIKHIQPLLEKNRLLLIQPIGNKIVSSVIRCIDSNEQMVSEMELPNISDPQKMGSAITYFRRYTLQSLLALQAEDDDGNSASRQATKKPELTSKSAKWEKAVHSFAKGEADLTAIRKHYTLSEKTAEKLIAEAKTFKNEQ